MYVLGISAFYHDSAAAIIQDGNIIAAAQEERFTRKKHDATFPSHAIDYVLSEAGITLEDVEHVVFYDKPFLKFERLLETYISTIPRSFRAFCMAIPVWLKEKLFLKRFIVKELQKLHPAFSSEKLGFCEHHLSHAASAFYPSPFEEAVILTLDGVGEWTTTAICLGKGRRIDIKRELHFPHSLGLLYSAFTYYTGFRVNSGEYKLMGLAPYGEPKYAPLIMEKLIDVKEDGSFRLDQSYFNYMAGLTMTNKKFDALFGQPARKPDHGAPTQFHMDVAASIQKVTEQIVLKMVRHLAKEYEIENLCLAGGVALNCVANGKIVKDGAFKNVWIQPAAGDAGGALGAALSQWHHELGNSRTPDASDAMKGSYLGPTFSDSEIEQRLEDVGAVFETLTDEQIVDKTAKSLSNGKAIGWLNGRMEFGPRALGNRSILADPRSPKMQKQLNLKVKFRESFRPFAPSILAEHVKDWFDLDGDSPYMLLVDQVAKDKCHRESETDKALTGLEKLAAVRTEIPAVTHVDYSARIQTVHETTNPKYHALITRFNEITGCPILVNTSFNVRGEPIVCTPEDAFACFMGTNIDVLVCGNAFLEKERQTVETTADYLTRYELD